jgi:hypothetical protein
LLSSSRKGSGKSCCGGSGGGGYCYHYYCTKDGRLIRLACICLFVPALPCALEHACRFDDALDAFGVHGVGGMIGSILTGFFANKHITGDELKNGSMSV